MSNLRTEILFECSIQLELFQSLKEHVLSSTTFRIYLLTESIIMEYVNIRIHFITKWKLSKAQI